MATQLLSPILICAGAVVLIALERLSPYQRGQKLLRAGLVTDLVFYGLLQGYVVGALVKLLLERLESRPGLVSGWPLAAQLALFLLAHDLYIYWFHRWQHSSRVLFRLHEVHHAARELDWIATSRTHALELAINLTVVNAPLLLLGAAPEVAAIRAAVDAVWGMYIHSNIDVGGSFLHKILNGPAMHRWHHSAGAGRGVNFATKLAVWDWLFGTASLPERAKPEAYGLWGDESFPAGYLAEGLHAFRPLQQQPGVDPVSRI
jgi:sterol desaturase/sphingolipid hydroxylase (fatty acid hydroxylase superfamily)